MTFHFFFFLTFNFFSNKTKELYIKNYNSNFLLKVSIKRHVRLRSAVKLKCVFLFFFNYAETYSVRHLRLKNKKKLAQENSYHLVCVCIYSAYVYVEFS